MADIFAIATRVHALTKSRDRVSRYISDRRATLDKLPKRKAFAKQYAHHIKVLAALTDEYTALTWAINKAKEGS